MYVHFRGTKYIHRVAPPSRPPTRRSLQETGTVRVGQQRHSRQRPAAGSHPLPCLGEWDCSRDRTQVESNSLGHFASGLPHSASHPQVHPRCSMCQKALPIKGWAIFTCMDNDTLYLLYLSIIQGWTLGMLPPFGHLEWCCYKHS